MFNLQCGKGAFVCCCLLAVFLTFTTILYFKNSGAQWQLVPFRPADLLNKRDTVAEPTETTSKNETKPAQPKEPEPKSPPKVSKPKSPPKVSKPKKVNPAEALAVKSTNFSDAGTFRHEDSYKKYMQCPTTLRNKFLESKVFKDRFVLDIPVLMWNEHMTEEEYTRLLRYYKCYGWYGYGKDLINRTLSHMSAPTHQYMFDNHLNGTEKNKCIRCAVVGNGGILKGSGKGKEIDEHDYVFRVNIARLKGYEIDVGSKTSFYTYTFTTLKNALRFSKKAGWLAPPHEKETKFLVLPCEIGDYLLVENRASGKTPEDFLRRMPKDRRMSLPNLGKSVKNTDFKMIHPDLMRYVEWNMIQSKRKSEYVNRPSTGAMMLLAAIHTCDEVSAYGFGVNYTKYTNHYYDKTFQKFHFYNYHDFNEELRLWNELDSEGIIKLYKKEDD